MNDFLLEIQEQPQALTKTLNFYTKGKGEAVLSKIAKVFNEHKFEQIVFTGMGSSNFISCGAVTLFNSLNIKSFCINSSELLHYNFSVLTSKTLLVCFSQSGESFEIREILKKLPEQVFCIGITNEEESTLAKQSNIALLTRAGREEMTSTKTYVTGTLVAFIFGWSVAKQWNSDKVAQIEAHIKSFESVLNSHKNWLQESLDFLGELPALQVIARGASYSTALQSGLMFKEAIKVAASGILGGEFRHGPMEMVQKGFKCILFAPQGKTYAQSIKMANDIADNGGKVLLITNADSKIANNNVYTIVIEEQDEFLFSIQSIIPIQLFIDEFAKQRGFEAGSFAIGGKVTMIE